MFCFLESKNEGRQQDEPGLGFCQWKRGLETQYVQRSEYYDKLWKLSLKNSRQMETQEAPSDSVRRMKVKVRMNFRIGVNEMKNVVREWDDFNQDFRVGEGRYWWWWDLKLLS